MSSGLEHILFDVPAMFFLSEVAIQERFLGVVMYIYIYIDHDIYISYIYIYIMVMFLIFKRSFNTSAFSTKFPVIC